MTVTGKSPMTLTDEEGRCKRIMQVLYSSGLGMLEWQSNRIDC